MATDADRVERLIAREAGECCDGDVAARLRELEGRAEEAATTAAPDGVALRTLGDETRYTIARLLAAGDRELCVCEIAPVLDVSDSAVSHALSDLREADLVTRRKDGTWRYYAATDRTRALLSALDATREPADAGDVAGGDRTDG